MIQKIQFELRELANVKREKVLRRFFKTGKGEYAEGDKFYGITVPETREVAKKYADSMALSEVEKLLHSQIHEERLAALMILAEQFKKGNDKIKEKIYRLYLRNTRYINNWDLIDLTADRIVGASLDGEPKDILEKLARSQSLWERRIAIISTWHYIRQKKYRDTFKIAKLLLQDKHDLIHKAVGWMLREVGKHCGQDILESFLRAYAPKMPRTTLRYAIERLPERKKRYYLNARNNKKWRKYMPKEGGAINGDIMKRTETAKSPTIVINVSSVDEYVKKVEAAGGKLVEPKKQIMDMGYYARVSDTEGNTLGL